MTDHLRLVEVDHTPEEELHIALVREAGCTHPAYHDLGEHAVAGWCDLCRAKHVEKDPAWQNLPEPTPDELDNISAYRLQWAGTTLNGLADDLLTAAQGRDDLAYGPPDNIIRRIRHIADDAERAFRMIELVAERRQREAEK